MKTFSSLFCLLVLVCSLLPTTSAFVSRPPVTSPSITFSTDSAKTSSTSLNVFGTKKSKAQKEAEAEKAAMYWEGEWVCKDCGYIYQRVSIVDDCIGLSMIWRHLSSFYCSMRVGFIDITCLQNRNTHKSYLKFWSISFGMEKKICNPVRMRRVIFRRTKPWFQMPTMLWSSSSLCKESRRSCWNDPRWRWCADSHLQYRWFDPHDRVWGMGRWQLINWANCRSIYSYYRAIKWNNTLYRDIFFLLVLWSISFRNSLRIHSLMALTLLRPKADDISICADLTTNKTENY